MNSQRIYRELNRRLARGERLALATLVSTGGSSPQNAGAKVLFLPDGQIVGTIGGGCMEVEARQVGLACLRSGTCSLFELKLDDDFGWDDGLICGGTVRIFINPAPERSAEAFLAAETLASEGGAGALCTLISGSADLVGLTTLVRHSGSICGPGEIEELVGSESGPVCAVENETVITVTSGEQVYVEPVLSRPTLLIAGAGHIGAAVAQIGALCGFETVVVDDRPAFANAERLPFADRVEVAEIPSFIQNYPIGDRTYVVIVTRGHRNDAQVLRACIHSRANYIGMIGSKRKIVVIFEELLRDELATKEELRRVRSPMGLNLGDREVGEIAVSVMAEITAVRNGVDPDSVRSMQYLPPCVQP